ncbi:molybdate ABC transporter substrate-binding protein [Labedaea rhizosphaerae]|uniref:Molybdate-binding protein ModA n=1 Tax=Labedaea rhizosphaerae TaxID=598644 RepID=A0A4R6SKU0_LABRH|nr:molybdate ABC transporter substrate-binding protein [Labedaea rhizosphaerae]TDQ04547.1 molybdate transport system substrate-binding protein [Labedaea rhizosphaerae]
MNRVKLTAVLAAVAFAAGACTSSDAAQSGRTGGQLIVLAAASLTESFGRLEKQFEAAHPGVDVKISFGGSSALVQQIVNGAPADVFASADQKNMDKLTQAGLNDGPPRVFAVNELEIAVAPGNPKKIASFADLAKDGTTVVVCAEQVPCGSATKKVEDATGTRLKPVSEEQDVKSVLNKVTSGEADAGLVYVTDVNSARGKVDGVAFPEAGKALNDYPIVAVKDAPQAALAREFVDFVLGDQGKAALTGAGFRLP